MKHALGLLLLACLTPGAYAQDKSADDQSATQTQVQDGLKRRPLASVHSYVLGPDDQITIRALHVEEITAEPMRIAPDGSIRLPLAGRIMAAGQTADQLQQDIVEKLRPFIVDPEVTVSITDFRSEPVSVLGAVRTPGVYQLQGNKTLAEMLSLAGGMDPAAGSVVKITRPLEHGAIPMRGATVDPTGQFSVAEVNLTAILKAEDPASNIVILPRDVITVPRAEMVFVMGQVQRAGGFVLNDAANLTLLQALSMAGGLGNNASPKNALLLKSDPEGGSRKEVPVNLRDVLQGKSPDMAMSAGDILLVPDSLPKKAAVRALEAAVQAGTGIAIWHKY